jgi:Na+-transporting NADH:ubiquinone oxidoreductase subunit NqrC
VKLGRKLLDVLFIVVLGAVSVTLLLAMQSYAAPAVRRYRETRLKTNVLTAAGVPFEPADYERVFAATVQERTGGGLVWFQVDSLLVYEFRGRGLWGMIEGVITLDTALTRIKNVRILAQEETPGLGSRIAEPEYLATYNDRDVTGALELTLRHKAEAANQVDAIAGATLSSQALIDAVSQAVQDLRAARAGGGR